MGTDIMDSIWSRTYPYGNRFFSLYKLACYVDVYGFGMGMDLKKNDQFGQNWIMLGESAQCCESNWASLEAAV